MVVKDKVRKIEGVFEKYYKDFGFSGVGYLKAHDDILYSEAFGYAHKGWEIQNTVKTRFDVASITKLFTAAAILKVIDDGECALNDRVLDLLEIEDTTISKEVTLYHLLTHTSGIGDDADEEAGESYEDLWIHKPNYSVRKTADFLPQFIHKPMNFNPGEGCRYNNVAFVLLGLVIEKLKGQSYREYVTEHIFKALNMNDSAFLSMDGVNKNCAEGYSRTENGEWVKNIYSYPPIGSPDGGAYTTVFDLEQFLQGIKSGMLLSTELTEAFLTPKEVYRKRGNIVEMKGFGFDFEVDEGNNILNIGKDGLNAGVAAILHHSPQENTTLIILANQNCNVWKMRDEIKEIMGKRA